MGRRGFEALARGIPLLSSLWLPALLSSGVEGAESLATLNLGVAFWKGLGSIGGKTFGVACLSGLLHCNTSPLI